MRYGEQDAGEALHRGRQSGPEAEYDSDLLHRSVIGDSQPKGIFTVLSL